MAYLLEKIQSWPLAVWMSFRQCEFTQWHQRDCRCEIKLAGPCPLGQGFLPCPVCFSSLPPGFDAEDCTRQPGNHPGTQRREVIKFSHSLLPALIHIAGSFTVCISEEPLAVGFSSKAIDVPYAFTSDMPYWGLEKIHRRRDYASSVYAHCLWL